MTSSRSPTPKPRRQRLDHPLLQQLRPCQYPGNVIPPSATNLLDGKPIPLTVRGGDRRELYAKARTGMVGPFTGISFIYDWETTSDPPDLLRPLAS